MLLESTQNNDAGSHTVTLEVSLTDYPQITKQVTITVSIESCVVTETIGTAQPSESFAYQVGNPQAVAFTYEFAQNLNCGYAETYEVVGVPDFVQHDETDKQFTIFSNDLNDAGEYTFKLISTVSIPTGGTVTGELDLTVTLVATCDSTQFVEWSLDGENFSSSVTAGTQTV